MNSSETKSSVKQWHTWAVFPLLALIVGVIYSPSVNGQFIWDDIYIYIVNNELLRSPIGLWKFWFSNEPADYFPLTYSTFWLEWRFAHEDPRLYHITNMILHCATGAVLYRLLCLLKIPAPLWITLLFVVHPLQVESVAWISQRKTLLAAFFGFAAASQYVSICNSNDKRWANYLLAILFFFLSLAGKPTLIVLPCGLLLFDIYGRRFAPQPQPLSPSTGRGEQHDEVTQADEGMQRVRTHGEHRSQVVKNALQSLKMPTLRALPLLALSAIFGVVGIFFQQKLIGGLDVRNQDELSRLASLGWTAGFYGWKMLSCWDLSFVYSRWNINGAEVLSWIPNALALATLLGAFLLRKKVGSIPFASMLLYLLTMLPALGIADVFFWRYSYVGDHYVYQSLPLLLTLIAVPAIALKQRLKMPQSMATAIAIGVVFGLGWISFERAKVYCVEKELWTDTLQKNPDAIPALSFMSTESLKHGEFDKAENYLDRALALDDRMFEAWLNKATVAYDALDWQNAVEFFEKAYEYSPESSAEHVESCVGLAAAYIRTGAPQKAFGVVEIALSLLEQAKASNVKGRLGSLYMRSTIYRQRAALATGRDQLASAAYARAKELLEDRPELVRAAAIAFFDTESYDDADKFLEMLRPFAEKHDAQLLFIMADRWFTKGEPGKAAELCKLAIALSPKRPELYRFLAITFSSLGNTSEAETQFRIASQLVPNRAGYHANLAVALSSQQKYEEALAELKAAAALESSRPKRWQEVAWLLATSPLAENAANVKEALAAANTACELTDFKNTKCLDSLAAAQAASGDFLAAQKTIDRAIESLGSQETNLPKSLQESLEQRKQLYANNRCYRIE